MTVLGLALAAFRPGQRRAYIRISNEDDSRGRFDGDSQYAEHPGLAVPHLPGFDPARQGGWPGRRLWRGGRLERFWHQGRRHVHAYHRDHGRGLDPLAHAPGDHYESTADF